MSGGRGVLQEQLVADGLHQRTRQRAVDVVDGLCRQTTAATHAPRGAQLDVELTNTRPSEVPQRKGPKPWLDVCPDVQLGLDPSAVKIRSRLLTGLATAYAQRGKIEEACRLAIESLWIAKRTEPEPSLRALYELRRHLDQHGESECVKELDEQLAR